MALFRKKPVVIEAVQLHWDNWNEICEFVGVGKLDDNKPQGCWVDPADGSAYDGNKPPAHLSLDDAEIGLWIPTLEGLMLARQDDWVIRGVQGELYACKPDIFAQTYDPVEQPNGVRPVTAWVDKEGRVTVVLSEIVAAGCNQFALSDVVNAFEAAGVVTR